MLARNALAPRFGRGSFILPVALVVSLSCTLDKSLAQSNAAAKFTRDFITHAAEEIGSRGLESARDGLIAYFSANKAEMNRPQSELIRRLAACQSTTSPAPKPANPDPLCEALKSGPQ